MSALSMLSIALLLAALVGCVALWNRSGETRVGIFGALFLLIAIQSTVALWTGWNQAFAWNLSALQGLAGIAAGTLAVFGTTALWRTLSERDRAEKLHWDSMEIVRVINELSADGSTPRDTKIARLLEMAAARFELEVAMLAKAHSDRFEVAAVFAPDHFPVASGAHFPLDEGFLKYTLDSERPVGIERIEASHLPRSRDRAAFGFRAYLGAAIRVRGIASGTLSFASFEPRRVRFNGTEKDLIRLIARWIGTEIENAEDLEIRSQRAVESNLSAGAERSPAALRREPRDDPKSAAIRVQPPRPERNVARAHVERAIDANRILEQIAGELRSLAGKSVHLAMKLDPDLGFAAAQNVPFKAIARTLVMNARDAMPDGGELWLETAHLEIAALESAQMPPMLPLCYVTLCVRHSGREIDADALARLFDPDSAAEPATRSDGRLPLSTVYRLLQACGGDLSVDVEPGRGSTFTVYLPRARDRVRVARAIAPALRPAAPRPTTH